MSDWNVIATCITAKPDDPVQIMAQFYTNDALRKLDLSRRVLLVQFLSDLHLITSTTNASEDKCLTPTQTWKKYGVRF